MEQILTVSELNNTIKSLLEESFDSLLVEGEVADLRRPQSGHTYFTLKDDKSQIRAVFFRPFGRTGGRVNFELEEGLKILCRARLTLYPPRGEYQLVVESVEPLGVGALQKAFEQLKAKLSAEGLFDKRYKKALPFLPGRIGVITSPTGAVIRDILNVSRRRFPATDILIAPVRVQGNDAANDMIQALRRFHAFGQVDVIILARGGGSLEDLASFNDERLAREIFRSDIPVVSAVGHETDFTICDFAADLRAPTPSAAAELVLPDRTELIFKVNMLARRMTAGCLRHLKAEKEHLEGLQERFKDPRLAVVTQKIRIDDLKESLSAAFGHRRQILLHKLNHLELRLKHQSPEQQINEKQIVLKNLRKELHSSLSCVLTALKERFQKDAAVLESLSPLAVLERGYSLTRTVPEGTLIRQTRDLHEGDEVNVLLAKGNFNAKIQKIF